MTLVTTRSVLIVGLARQGIALVRYLTRHGITPHVTDARPAEHHTDTLAQLAGLPVEYTLGGHPLTLLDGIDAVYVSGGVPLDIPLLLEARARGIPLTNDSQLFFEHAPCPILGITGSAGKTTTTTLTGEMCKLSGRTTWIGGNIGNPLLNDLDTIQPTDLAVIELSSFQLELMTCSPHIAAILNITPNHLDRHKTMAAYTAAKANIIRHQRPGDIAILGWDNPTARNLADLTPAEIRYFGLTPPTPTPDGAWLRDNTLILRTNGHDTPIVPRANIQLRGQHNVLNVLAAIALAAAAGVDPSTMAAAIRAFRGVPHRLQIVRQLNGVLWVNDSIATAPERTAAAIHAFTEPLVLLLGGRDKDLPWGDLAALAHQRARHIILFGEAASLIERALHTAMPTPSSTITRCNTLPEAVLAAARAAHPGDVVLLSPGGTSFDAYPDFAARGHHFTELVHALPETRV